MKRTQKSTSEAQSIEAIREKLSSLTPEDFQWFLTLGIEDLCVSFSLRDDSRGCVEMRGKTWDGLLYRVAAIDWAKQRGEVFADVEKQEAFLSGGGSL